MLAAREQSAPRLNVMLSDFDEPWADQLPRLLEPQGVTAFHVHDADEALRLIEHQPIHAVVVELTMQMGSSGIGETGGLKLLRVIQRIDPPPPTVVIRPRRFDVRADDRVLTEALRLDAFSVLDQPVALEQLLDVLRRILARHYEGRWPC